MKPDEYALTFTAPDERGFTELHAVRTGEEHLLDGLQTVRSFAVFAYHPDHPSRGSYVVPPQDAWLCNMNHLVPLTEDLALNVHLLVFVRDKLTARSSRLTEPT